jgi:hypothetical protein
MGDRRNLILSNFILLAHKLEELGFRYADKKVTVIDFGEEV